MRCRRAMWETKKPAVATGSSSTLQPLEDIHLTSNYRYELGSNSTRETVFVFAAVALFVLLIACINFINLSTARSTERAKEVGLRKTLGAERQQLISQFLGESITIAAISLAVALVAIQLLLPSFNALAEKSLTSELSRNNGRYYWVSC